MQYLNKVTGTAFNIAKQGVQIISNAAASSANGAVYSSHGNSAISAAEEIQNLYEEICSIIDSLAMLPDAQGMDGDLRLNQSCIRDLIKKFTILLKVESDTWLMKEKSIYQSLSNKEMNDTPLPTIEKCLAMNMIPLLCKRAQQDTPRGLLPLMLTALSNLLRNIHYPLLPHQAIHKATRQLITTALEYKTRQALQSKNIPLPNSASAPPSSITVELQQSYQRRIGKYISIQVISNCFG